MHHPLRLNHWTVLICLQDCDPPWVTHDSNNHSLDLHSLTCILKHHSTNLWNRPSPDTYSRYRITDDGHESPFSSNLNWPPLIKNTWALFISTLFPKDVDKQYNPICQKRMNNYNVITILTFRLPKPKENKTWLAVISTGSQGFHNTSVSGKTTQHTMSNRSSHSHHPRPPYQRAIPSDRSFHIQTVF